MRYLALALTAGALLAPSAHAQTTATVLPTLSARPGATATLRVTVKFADPGAVVPVPLRQMGLRLPAGMTLEVPHLRSCNPSRLRVLGRRGCPVRSMLGRGHALVEAYLSGQTVAERVSLWAYLGPPRNLQPTVEILALGHTPFEQRTLLSASLLAGSASFGEQLVVFVPPIATLPLEPAASIVSLSLTVGAAGQGRARTQNSVRVPHRCPAGGFPVAGEFAYADGSSGATNATIPCPNPQRSR